MTDAIRVFDPGFQVTNSAGTPQSGAILRFYAAGTSTTRTVYSDLGLSTSLGVTVTCNSAGRPAASGGAGAEVLIYTGTTAYKVTAETSAGVSLWSFDNVIGALDTSAFLTGSVIAETPAVNKTSDYTIVDGDQGKAINANATGGSFTLTLPSAVTVGDGWRITLRNTGTANQVNIVTVSAQTIDGQSSYSMTVYLQSVTILSDGANFHIADTANPPVVARMYTAAGLGFSLIGGNVVASVSSNALTFAIKNSAGNDPSAFAPVKVVLRGQSADVEEATVLNLTAATSVTVPDTATLGTASGTAFRIWVVGFDDGGTYRIGVINCLSGMNIYALGQFPIASSTSVGAGSDSAHVFYTGTGVSSKPYHIVGYATWETGLGTAGTWSAAPTRFQLFGQGVPLPGVAVQTLFNQVRTAVTGSTVTPFDDTIPQNTEGVEMFTLAVTPTSAANILNLIAGGFYGNDGGGNDHLTQAIFQDSTADALAATVTGKPVDTKVVQIYTEHRLLAGTGSETTFKVRTGVAVAGTTRLNSSSAAQVLGGVASSGLTITELMA